MNKLALILPNSFETDAKFKDLRKDIFTNFCVESIIALPPHTFQPHAAVSTIILYLTAKKEQKHFWHFEVKNDGYTQNKRREKKEGENDFDTFCKFQNSNEQAKLKNGFQKAEIEKGKYQMKPSYNLSNIWTITPEEKEKRLREKLANIKSSIEHFKESIKLQTDYLVNLHQEKRELEEYFQQKQRISEMVNATATRDAGNV